MPIDRKEQISYAMIGFLFFIFCLKLPEIEKSIFLKKIFSLLILSFFRPVFLYSADCCHASIFL